MRPSLRCPQYPQFFDSVYPRIQADSSDSSIQADSSIRKNVGDKNAAGHGAPLGNRNAAGHGAQLLGNKNGIRVVANMYAAGRGGAPLGNKNAAKKGLGVRIAAFAAKHGPPAYVAADQVLKKNAENDEQADVAAGQVKKNIKKDQVC